MEVSDSWASASTHPLGVLGTTFRIHRSLDLGFLGATEGKTLQNRMRCKLPGQGNCSGRGVGSKDGTLQNSHENAHEERISMRNICQPQRPDPVLHHCFILEESDTE